MLIAFTNHALDHMLSSILDADITQRIVRLGRRVNDERISKYSMETLEMVQNHSRLDRTFSDCRRELKKVQECIQKLMRKVLDLDVDNNTVEIMNYLSTLYPEHFAYLSSPPPWVSNIKGFVVDAEDGAGEWQTTGRGGKAHVLDRSTYAFWRDCTDLSFIHQITNELFNPWKPSTETAIPAPQNAFSVLEVEEPDDNHSLDEEELSDTESSSMDEMEVEESWKVLKFDHDSSLDPPIQIILPEASEMSPPLQVENTENTIGPADVRDADGFFDALGFECTPSVPLSDRPLDELLENVGDVWEMSRSERRRIDIFWMDQTRIHLGRTYMDEFERLRKRHADKLQECDEGKAEVCYFYLFAMLNFSMLIFIRFAETCSVTWISSVAPRQVASFQLSIDKLLMAIVFHDIGAAQLTTLLKVGRFIFFALFPGSLRFQTI